MTKLVRLLLSRRQMTRPAYAYTPSKMFRPEPPATFVRRSNPHFHELVGRI